MKTNLKRTLKLFITTVIVMSFILTSVTPALAAAKDPKFSKTKVSVAVGKTVSLKVINKVAKSTYKWTTSNKAVATVSTKGAVKGIKAGTATVTCKVTTPKKVKFTLTSKVTVTAAAAATTPTKAAEPTKAAASKKAVLSEDFSKDAGSFTARAATIEQVAKTGQDGKNGYLMVTGRKSAWNGAATNVTALVKAGKSYTVTGWVKYTEGAATEDFKISQQKTDGSGTQSWPAISEVTTAEKGKWTMITGTMTVDADASTVEVYFECDKNATLEFMCDSFTIVED